MTLGLLLTRVFISFWFAHVIFDWILCLQCWSLLSVLEIDATIFFILLCCVSYSSVCSEPYRSAHLHVCPPVHMSLSLSLSGLPLLCFRSVTLIALPFNGESLHGNTHVQHTITTHTHSTHNSPNTHTLRYLYYQAQKIPLICVEMFRVLIIFRRNTISVQFTIFFWHLKEEADLNREQ